MSQEPTAPLTKAESSDWTETSTYQDVAEFIASLSALEHGDRLRLETFGTSNEGRAMLLVTAASPMPSGPAEVLEQGKLRILINANIHSGEVEGKEAVQMIMREIAQGGLKDILEHAVLLFVPIYNLDGNERIDKHNRSSQNGPDGGVGIRPNAQGLDLNRDFIKAESPECRALLGLFNSYDPHLFIDLHTTNGSNHGYHLTYAPSLSTNVDSAIDAFMRQVILPEVRTVTRQQHDFRIFDYGNFTRRGERKFTTYDHRPRFGTNYYGLRNRFSILSEAYSYVAFKERVAVTRAFVLQTLQSVTVRSREIKALCEAADQRMLQPKNRVSFGHDTSLAPPEVMEVLTRDLERVPLPGDLGTRVIALQGFETESMPVQLSFRSQRRTALPWAWAITEPDDEVLAKLRLHGLRLHRVETNASVAAETFHIDELRRGRRLFQGHHEVSLVGRWVAKTKAIPKGTVIILARQELGRLAAQLLTPESEDSLSTWEILKLTDVNDDSSQPVEYPVLRLGAEVELDLVPMPQPAQNARTGR